MRIVIVSLGVSALLLLGCGDQNRGSGVSYAGGVSASLSANANLSAAQISTFQSDVRSRWAVAYDPAVPAGCVPGGLRPGVQHPPIAERPCKAYLLERLKTTWHLRAVGHPGQIDVPKNAPADLGDPDRLKYLGST